MRARDPDSRFRLFPTDDPDTWGRAGGHAPLDEFDDAWRNDPRAQVPRNPPPHRGEQAAGDGEEQAHAWAVEEALRGVRGGPPAQEE